MNNRQNGFTLIEVLVSLAVIALLGFLIIPRLGFLTAKNVLDAESQKIISLLRVAKSKTVGSEDLQNYGVYFASASFTLFQGTAFDPGDPKNETHPLDKQARISSVTLPGRSVYFERLTGEASAGGLVVLEDKNDPQKNQTVHIDASGLIGLAAEITAQDDDRLKDSRHLHLDFAQNTQESSQLVFFFPENSVSQAISYQAFLNADKSSFNWSGSFNVGGQTQTLEIHTHSLTPLAAEFCFHRDGRENTKALNISLDGENLVNYTPDGAITAGTSPFASEPEIQ